MHTEWVNSVVDEAIMIQQAPEIFNTDQGSQFKAQLHAKLLKENNESFDNPVDKQEKTFLDIDTTTEDIITRSSIQPWD